MAQWVKNPTAVAQVAEEVQVGSLASLSELGSGVVASYGAGGVWLVSGVAVVVV